MSGISEISAMREMREIREMRELCELHKKVRSSGFTLIELMIVIALIGVIASFAVPQMGRMIDNNRVVSTANSVVGLLNFSRSEAIRRGARISVAVSANSAQATLTADGTVVRVMEPAAGGVGIGAQTGSGAAVASIVFRSSGMTVPPTDATGNAEDILIDVCAGDATGRRITVNPGGKITTAEYVCP